MRCSTCWKTRLMLNNAVLVNSAAKAVVSAPRRLASSPTWWKNASRFSELSNFFKDGGISARHRVPGLMALRAGAGRRHEAKYDHARPVREKDA